jgi:DHA1 family bicyclomycin/chloramphenicol resistance-like MFS transporter
MSARRQSFLLILTLGILDALTPFSIDLYLPAFTAIARELNTPVARVSLSVSIYFIGFAMGQILYGPLLDRYGRKRPLYAGLAIYLLATVGCMSAHSIEALLFFRMLSALGGAATSVGAMAMVRDFFAPEESARIFSMLMLVISISPLLAPSVGSLLTVVLGWRAIFALLAVIAGLEILLVAFALPEAYKPDASVSLRLGPVLREFGAIYRHPRFRAFTFAGSLSFAGLFVFVAGSPAIFMEGFGVGPKTYGAIFALLAGGMIGGGQLNHLLAKRYPSERIFGAVLAVQVVASLAFVAGEALVGLGLLPTAAVLFVILVCAGISFPNAAAIALAPFERNAGSASALMGFLQLGVGSVIAAIVGLLDTRGTLPTAVVMGGSSALAWVIYSRRALAWSEK